MKSITEQTEKTPVVASPNINISHQRSRKAAETMKKIEVDEEQETPLKPRNIDKILVAVDGSEKSDEARDFALNLGQTVNAEIELLTVIQNLVLPWFGSVEASASKMDPSYMTDYYEDQRKYSEDIVEKAKKKAKRDYPELKISKKVVRGVPDRMIVEEAKKGFDLVVVGSRGHGFIDELVLGSVSKGVVDGSPVPVLVVK
jgi:nucleotide-binding universal stress UspA family protein